MRGLLRTPLLPLLLLVLPGPGDPAGGGEVTDRPRPSSRVLGLGEHTADTLGLLVAEEEVEALGCRDRWGEQ